MRNPKDPSLKRFNCYMYEDIQVFVIRCFGKRGVDHVVDMDTRYELMYDSEEPYYISMPKESFILCAGGSSKTNITGVIEIVDVLIKLVVVKSHNETAEDKVKANCNVFIHH